MLKDLIKELRAKNSGAISFRTNVVGKQVLRGHSQAPFVVIKLVGLVDVLGQVLH